MVEPVPPSPAGTPPDPAGAPADDVRALLTVVALGHLVASYADVVTRRAWHELDDLFLADAPVTLELHRDEPIRLVGGSEVGSFVAAAIERFDFFAFTVLNHVVDRTGATRASGRLYLAEVRRAATDAAWSTAYGLYRDEYALIDGTWRFAARRYTSLGRRSGDVGGEVFGVPDWATD